MCLSESERIRMLEVIITSFALKRTIFYNYIHIPIGFKKRYLLTDKDIRFKTFAAVILISLIPSFLLYIVISAESSREFHRMDSRFLQHFRDVKLGQIDILYKNTLFVLENSTEEWAVEILRSGILPTDEDKLESISGINRSLIRTYYFDSDRKALDLHSFSDKDLVSVQRVLSDRIFNTATAVVFLSLPDNRPVLCRFKKYIYRGNLLGYTADLLDLSFVDPVMSVPDSYQMDLYNEEFELSRSTTEKQTGVVTINDLTKRMLDGYMEVGEYDGMMHAFGFTVLGETALYATVYTNTASLDAHSRVQVVTLGFFLLILLCVAYISAWKLHREILGYAESILVQKTFSKDMKFFSRVKDNLVHISENASALEKIDTELKYMKNDITYILETIADYENKEE